MAVVTDQGTVKITPTAWRWYLGAAVVLWLASVTSDMRPLLLLIAVSLAAFGTGRLSHVILDAEGFEYRNIISTKRVSWDHAGEFSLTTYRSGFIPVAQMLMYTDPRKSGTAYAKFSKFVAGGTRAVPFAGIKPKEMLALFTAYKQRHSAGQPLPQPAFAPRAPVHAPKTQPVPAGARVPAAKASKPVFGKSDPNSQPALVVDSRWRKRATRNAPLG